MTALSLEPFIRLQNDMVRDLETLVSSESPSADHERLAATADVLTEMGMALLGSRPRRLPGDKCEHLLWNFGGACRILIIGHYDTVWPSGTTDRWPFSVVGDKATGPGAFDMKAGLIQAFYAVQALGCPKGVQILVTGDEEIGSPSSRKLIEQLAAGVEAVLVLEASLDGALKTSRKGAGMYRLLIHGLASHAGLEPEAGVNATLEVAAQIIAIGELTDAPAGTTVTPTTLRSGVASNQIPASAWLDVDVRATTVEELARVDAALRSLTTKVPGASLQLEGGIDRGPLESQHAAVLFNRAAQVGQTLGVPPLRQAMAGGTSDGNLTAAMGIPTLDGLGAVGAGAHREGEWVQVSAMPERAAILAGIIDSLLVNPVDKVSAC